jgi:apolipoprotein N-acyltransferase
LTSTHPAPSSNTETPRIRKRPRELLHPLKGRLGWIPLSLLSSLFLVLSFPKPGIAIFAWIALVPLFVVFMTAPFGRSLLASTCTGTVFYLVNLFWMKEYKHPLALSGGVFGVMVFWLGATIISHFLLHRSGSRRGIGLLALTCGWFTIDYVKTIGYLGFPWGILGYSQYENLALIQSASMFGVWGIDFLIIFVNAVLAGLVLDLFETRGKRVRFPKPAHFLPLYVSLLLLIASLVWGTVKLLEEKHADTPTKRIALIQANFDPWSPKLHENIAEQIELTLEALPLDPDLIVWSESSVPFPYVYYLERENPHALRVHRFAAALKKPFVLGTLEFEQTNEEGRRGSWHYNVAVYYNRGKLEGTYRKIHLVPFGEWFPYKRLFPFVATILDAAGAGDFTPGDRYTLFRDSDMVFNVLICFEDAFGNLARQFVRRGSQLMINVTNDAWTGSEMAEIQHYSIAVFRTIENRRSLVRAANGGVTACINPYGRQTGALELFTSDVLVCDVSVVPEDVRTFYTRFGELLPLCIVPLTLLGCIIHLAALCIRRCASRKKP